MKHILKCLGCASYTMSTSCPKCGAKASTVKPAKFSPEDKFAGYRRSFKEEELKKKGWL
jgi:H/ACA ribonucleoprotein complex subunit 3